ncbi:hypothetical protein BCR34DRAFT_573462 [Clohesyomyces aquaticus]|uniref:DUF1640-domain-containing protein n=1 Tax=Clohesyomyces aquaticus TaxID=1231657 RepID=A0A1Y1Z043_9PLEO|nr:hypothetical protein BCR34DRAFT_573462 [Clohesyomyces aquaticus]
MSTRNNTEPRKHIFRPRLLNTTINMAAPRLPFLWPLLYRPIKPAGTLGPSRITARNIHLPNPVAPAPPPAPPAARRPQSTVAQRYGTAQEPAPHFREGNLSEASLDMLPKPSTGKPSPSSDAAEDADDEDAFPPSSPSSTPSSGPRVFSAAEATPPRSAPAPEPVKGTETNPVDTVLEMPSPDKKPPHLSTPRYVHHFDTYTLVRDLSTHGFTPDQSVILMKGIRSILTSNMTLARESLVSKSKVENEAYLFRAACSELKTEVMGRRRGEAEKMRSERNLLGHEVEILGQRLGQETGGLRDELKGLFDDRKMAVRMEQRSMETKIQELNYKITVALNSDARSEVEGLRWVLTRRAAIAIGVSAFMLFALLRYSSYVAHVQSEERKRAAERKPPPPDQGAGGGRGRETSNAAAEASGGELLVSEGGVSLG